ncbi:MAG TPA: glycosyltransferase family 39 protein [Micropepsaceae bacterium]|nr:glycosyltransferase family 39 protein [Micropepsaceae bacterium]
MTVSSFWQRLDERRFALRATLVIVLALAVVRIAVLIATPLNLGPDEAQYWFWSLTPDFGYFSKPPLIAWSIGATTSLCGDSEACVRLASPLYAAGTALVCFFIGLRLFGARAGFLSAVIFTTLPASFFSALLITTDVPLLFFWALTLLGLAALIHDERPSGPALALAIGAAAGLGFLAKYAMGYAALCLSLLILMDARARARLFTLNGALIVGAFVLTISPNIIWNAAHGFPTFWHTAENANWQADSNFNPEKLAEFAGAQLGLLGPFTVFLLALAAIALWKNRNVGDALSSRMKFLLLFSLPILLIGLAQSFISRANANWAAPAFLSAVIAVAGMLARDPRIARALWLAAPHAIIGILLYSLAVSPALISALGRENDVKRLRGWDVQAANVLREAERMGANLIVSDDREDMASLLYYTRHGSLPVRMWVDGGHPQNHFEMFLPYMNGDETIALVTRRRDPSRVLASLGGDASEPVDLTLELGGGKVRNLKIFAITPAHANRQ